MTRGVATVRHFRHVPTHNFSPKKCYWWKITNHPKCISLVKKLQCVPIVKKKVAMCLFLCSIKIRSQLKHANDLSYFLNEDNHTGGGVKIPILGESIFYLACFNCDLILIETCLKCLTVATPLVIECSEMYANLCYVDYEEWQAIFPWIDAYSLRF
jgi:hypothetical protein